MKVISLFPSSLAYSWARSIVVALNSMFVDFDIRIDVYVSEVIDYFPIKSSIAVYPKRLLRQLTLF